MLCRAPLPQHIAAAPNAALLLRAITFCLSVLCCTLARRRLQKPRKFLGDLHKFVKPGGVAVIISPYSWQAEYTDPSVRTPVAAIV